MNSRVFSTEQVGELEKPLDSRHVRSRDGLSYIEGWHAISEANRIFGFGNWSGEIISLELIGETSNEMTKGRNAGKTQHRVAYRCVYRVDVSNSEMALPATFSDVGFGNAISYGNVLDTHENAMKEAVTDAMKRALRNFGNQFGNALYDKEQRNVDTQGAEREQLAAQAAEVENGMDVTLDMVNAAFKLVPPVKQDKAKQLIVDTVRKHGAEKLSDASQEALKEVYGTLQKLAA